MCWIERKRKKILRWVLFPIETQSLIKTSQDKWIYSLWKIEGGVKESALVKMKIGSQL